MMARFLLSRHATYERPKTATVPDSSRPDVSERKHKQRLINWIRSDLFPDIHGMNAQSKPSCTRESIEGRCLKQIAVIIALPR